MVSGGILIWLQLSCRNCIGGAEKMVLDDALTIVTRDVRSLVAMQGAVEAPMFTTT
jgi:hypothetical protein